MKAQLKANNLLEISLWMLYGLAIVGCIVADVILMFTNYISSTGSSFVLLIAIASILCVAIFTLQFIVYKKAKNTLAVYLTACLLEPVKFTCMVLIVVKHMAEFTIIARVLGYTLILLFIAIITLQILLLIDYIRVNSKISNTQKHIQAEVKSKKVLEAVLCALYGLAMLGCMIVDIVISLKRPSSASMYFMWNMLASNIIYTAIFIVQFIIYKKVKNTLVYSLIVCLLEPVKWYFVLFVIAGHFLSLLFYILIPLFMMIVPLQIILFIKGIVERKKKKNIQVQG